MKKKPSLSRLKKKAWTLFSEYIRRKYANSDGYLECVCCGIRKHWKELHAAHLVAGRKLGILFDERGVFPCCYGCNVMKHGNYREYDAYMVKMYGKEYTDSLIADLRRKSKQPTKWTREQFEEIIERYGNALKLFSHD